MGDAIDTGDEALRRELLDETLQECERLLATAEADATEIRHVAQRHAAGACRGCGPGADSGSRTASPGGDRRARVGAGSQETG